MEVIVTTECAAYDALDDNLTGVSRIPGAQTEVACGISACTNTLMYRGLGLDRKPVLERDLGICQDDAKAAGN